jgi:pimeloyl-ACP methyl ester carboxylesterase
MVFSTTLLCSGQEKAGDLKIEPYVFENAKKEKVEAEIGRLLVPENRRNPNSRLIEIAFVRFKSIASNPGAPIVYLAGGPGGSGIGAARGTRFPLFMAMREFGDVIALDQRGVGLSKPNLDCRETFGFPLDKALSYEDALAIVREKSRACAESQRAKGVDLAGYNTNENADDLEDLRKALGAKKISLWGISYGTHLALTAIKRHGKNIDRAILAGVEGLDDTLKPPGDVERHLADIDRLVKADANLNARVPDLLGAMKTVFDRLEKEPVTVEINDPKTKQPVKIVIGKYAMQLMTGSAIGTGTITFYPRIFEAAAKGDFSEAAQQWVNLSQQSIGTAMGYAMDCASGASAERLRRVERESKQSLAGNTANTFFPDVCDVWNVPDAGKTFRQPAKSDVPVLFISGTLDGRTPVGNAEAVAKGFRNGKHLIIEGAWHSDPLFLSSPQIKDVMLEFMRGAPLSTTNIKLAPIKFAPLK